MTNLSILHFLIFIKAKQNSNRLETFLLMATQKFCILSLLLENCFVLDCYSLDRSLECHPYARISYYYILI